LHAEIELVARHLHVIHAARTQCRNGCASCCVDDLTVFAVEAEAIQRGFGELLREGTPHVEGACAFLDEAGGCRVYAQRPYVCRTQGLPLRWLEETTTGEIIERRISVSSTKPASRSKIWPRARASCSALSRSASRGWRCRVINRHDESRFDRCFPNTRLAQKPNEPTVNGSSPARFSRRNARGSRAQW
jgi:hypothetical protein